MYQTVYNEYGEPMGTEYVREPWEEEIAYYEEMDRRAEDPIYAASVENQRWYNAACAAFEDRGIEVPEDVIAALAREMRLKKRREDEARALNEVQPLVDLLNEIAPECEAKAYYYPETPIEIATTEIHFLGKNPSDEDIDKVKKACIERGLDICVDDYVY